MWKSQERTLIKKKRGCWEFWQIHGNICLSFWEIHYFTFIMKLMPVYLHPPKCFLGFCHFKAMSVGPELLAPGLSWKWYKLTLFLIWASFILTREPNYRGTVGECWITTSILLVHVVNLIGSATKMQWDEWECALLKGQELHTRVTTMCKKSP